MGETPRPDWTWNKWKFIAFGLGILFWVAFIYLAIQLIDIIV